MSQHASRTISHKASERSSTTDRHTSGQDETVVYPDGTGLSHPLDFPRSHYNVVLGLIIAAVVIGGIFAFFIADNVLNYDAKQAEQISKSLEGKSEIDTIRLTSYAGLDAHTMLSSMKESGLSVLDVTTLLENDPNAIDIVKVPEGMNAADLGAAYVAGLDKLKGGQAVTILADTWRVTQSSSSVIDLRLHYADLTASSADEAVDRALAAQGFGSSAVSDSGVDDKGNTYKSGTIEINSGSYEWKVSACALADVYDIAGLPSTSQYVGVRVHAL